MAQTPISQQSLNTLLSNSWSLDADKRKISKEFIFSDFPTTFSFMTTVAFEAEKRNHHPEWSNVYNKLTISWTTHDLANNLSELDYKMASFCDKNYSVALLQSQ